MVKMDSILFSKMSGAGNDFIVIDKNLNPDFPLSETIIRKLCDRRLGVGADGVITIEDAEQNDFIMNYYNADGSFGSLCGNGARCGIRFAHVTGRIINNLTNFTANNSDYSGRVIDERIVLFNLIPPKKIKYDFKVSAAGQLINACYADTGSPHVVIDIKDILIDSGNAKNFYENLNEVPVNMLGKVIRYSPDFEPGGTNVNFIKPINDKIYIRTYERGVEDETLACGTGAVAAAIISYVKSGFKPPIKIIPKSGEELLVDFQITDNRINNLSLTGPADIIYTGQIPLTFFN